MRRIVGILVLSILVLTLAVSCNQGEDVTKKEQQKVDGIGLHEDSNKSVAGGREVKPQESSVEKASEEVSERMVRVYYYNPVEDGIFYQEVLFNKNKNKESYFFEKEFKKAPSGEFVANMPKTTKINSINFYPKKTLVVMDVSENFTQLMNIGSGVESSIIQSIGNTICEAYGAKRMILTTNGEEYQGSHLEIGLMNSIAINTEGTKEIKK